MGAVPIRRHAPPYSAARIRTVAAHAVADAARIRSGPAGRRLRVWLTARCGEHVMQRSHWQHGCLSESSQIVGRRSRGTICDCEDSVAAVDAEDKARVYSNWSGLMQVGG